MLELQFQAENFKTIFLQRRHHVEHRWASL